MTGIEKICIIVSALLLLPLLMKVRMLLFGQIKPDDFFKKGDLFNVDTELFLSCLGIISFLLFLFFNWYQN